MSLSDHWSKTDKEHLDLFFRKNWMPRTSTQSLVCSTRQCPFSGHLSNMIVFFFYWQMVPHTWSHQQTDLRYSLNLIWTILIKYYFEKSEGVLPKNAASHLLGPWCAKGSRVCSKYVSRCGSPYFQWKESIFKGVLILIYNYWLDVNFCYNKSCVNKENWFILYSAIRENDRN